MSTLVRCATRTRTHMRWYIAVGGAVILAMMLRLPTFVMPHASGDQLIYSALAYGRAQGLSYNLDAVALARYDEGFITFVPADTGTLSVAALLYAQGITLYTSPLFFRAPGFPTLIGMASHATGQPLILWSHSPRGSAATPWRVRAKRQFSAVIVSFLSGCILIIATLIWARYWSRMVALWAVLLLAVCPVDIFAAVRIFTDTPMTAGIVLSLCGAVGFLRAQTRFARHSALILMIVAGAAAAWCKEAALVILLPALCMGMRHTSYRRRYVCAIMCITLSIMPWLVYHYMYTGLWLPLPPAGSEARSALYATPLSLGLVGAVILFPVGFFSVYGWRAAWARQPRAMQFSCIAVCMTCGIALVFHTHFEQRYLLPIYPFVVTWSACGCERVRQFLHTRRWSPVATVCVISGIIVAQALWGLYRAGHILWSHAGAFGGVL